MRPALKSVGLTMLLVGSTTIALCSPTTLQLPVLAQSTTTQDRKAEADRLVQQGLQQYQISQFEAAFQSWQQALQIYRAIEDRFGEGRSLGNVGIAYQALGKYAQAISYYQQGLAIAREIKDRYGEGSILGNLGATYGSSGNYTQAIPYLEQHLAITREIKDRSGEGDALGNLGSAYSSLGNYAKAIEYYQQSLTITRETKNQRDEGNTLGNLGVTYSSLGNYEKAIEYHQQRLAIVRETKDRQEEAGVLGKLGNAYYYLGNYAKAITHHEQRLAIAQETKDRQEEGDALGNLGVAYNSLDDHAKAITYLEQSLAIAQEIKDRRGEVAALGDLGVAYESLGSYDKAITYLEQSLAIAQEIKDRSGERSALGSLGIVYFSLSNYTKAIAYQEQSLALDRELKDKIGEVATLGNLGNIYVALGNYVKAITYQGQSLAIKREIKDRRGEGTSLGNLGTAYFYLSNYAKAIALHEQHLTIARELKDRSGEGNALGGLGMAYQFLGNYAKAITYQEQSLAIKREIKDRSGEGGALGNLGLAYYSLGNYAKAINYHEQSLAIDREIKNRRGEGTSLGNLGLAYHSLGNYAKAINYHEQSLAIDREIKNRQGEGASLGNLGIAYLLLGNDAKAVEYAQPALAIAREIGDQESEGIALNNIGFILTKRKQPELAIVFYKQSVSVRESIRESIRKLPQESQEIYAQSVAYTYRNLANLLLAKGRILEAQEVLELLKVQELKDFDRATRAKISNGKIELDPTEQAIVGKYTTFVEFGQKLRDCQNRKPQCADYDNLTKLRIAANAEYAQAVKSFEAAIKERKDKDEKNFLDPNNALNRKAQEIMTAQPNTPTAIIYSLVTDDKLWLVLVTKGEALRSFEIKLPQGELNETVRKFRALLEQCEAKTCTAADTAAFKVVSQQLYGWLFPAALQQELQRGNIKHLVFAQDRITRYIPMAALFDGKQYLIENYAVSTIISASFTYNDPPPKRQAISVLAAGLSNSVPPKFGALENVPRELNAIVQSGNTGIFPGLQLLNQTFDFLGLQKNLYRHNILHIATHGEFVRSQADASYILLGNGKPLPIPDILQLSDLGGVYLVVLSACQTALADRDATGIEISNVSYSFLDKGVKAVIASLWQVDDASTSLLMQQFYKQLAEGKPKVQALQEAQLRLLQSTPNTKNAVQRSPTLVPIGAPPQRQSHSADFSHPYYWAPFILIGNGL